MPGLEESPAWATALETAFAHEIELVALPKREPILTPVGIYTPPAAHIEAIEAERRFLSQPGRYNENQAVLDGPIDVARDPMVMPYRVVDYAAVKTLRRMRTPPTVLSASALPVCWETRRLYLQRRSPFVDLAPSRLHGFAGAFQPGSRGEEDSLVRTAARELVEETGLDVGNPDPTTPLAMFRDNVSGSLELVLLGLGITADQAATLRGCAEGEIETVSFDELPALLADTKQWATGGRFVTMAWLMVQAASSRFAGRSPPEVFWEALRAR